MTDTKALRAAIEAKGLKYKAVAAVLGLTPYGLCKKIENNTEFKASEIDKLSNLLGLSPKERDKIFFTRL